MIRKKKRTQQFYPATPFFNHFFERFFEDDSWSKKNPMSIDAVEKNDKYIIKADLPDYKKDEICISTRKKKLIIEASHKECNEKKKEKRKKKEKPSLPNGIAEIIIEAFIYREWTKKM